MLWGGFTQLVRVAAAFTSMITYADKLRDPRWQKKRLKIMERDGYACRDCGCKDAMITVHHTYYAKGGPWETPDECLMTLCDTCHAERQICENDIRQSIGLIVARLLNISEPSQASPLAKFGMLLKIMSKSKTQEPFIVDWDLMRKHYRYMKRNGLTLGMESFVKMVKKAIKL